MCNLFASQPPDTYTFETRWIRLNGQCTSIRLEKVFWGVLEKIATEENMTVPRFISTLHSEVLLLWGEMPNFTSHLRCVCIVAIETKRIARETETALAEAATRAAWQEDNTHGVFAPLRSRKIGSARWLKRYIR